MCNYYKIYICVLFQKLKIAGSDLSEEWNHEHNNEQII
jgi:hypothetical protein